MTPLHKTVKRRTLAPHRGRRIVVSLHPGDVLGFRLERTRKEFVLSVGGAYDFAVRLEAELRKRQKAAERKLRKGL